MRAGILGAGAIAFDQGSGGLPMTHAKSYAAMADRVSLVAFAELDGGQRDSVSDAHPNLAVYESMEAMLEGDDLDIVSLCTPDALHEENLMAILDYPVKGIWCEKPLALTEAGAQRVAARAAEKGVVIQVNYFRRFIPELLTLRQALLNGEYGALLSARGIYPETYRHNGCHLFDLIHFFLGELNPVLATVGEKLNEDHDGCVTVVGAVGGREVVCQGVPRRPYNIFELEMLFEWGRIKVAENGRRIERYASGPDNAFPHLRLLDPEPEVVSCSWSGSFDHSLENLIDGIERGVAPISGVGPSIVCGRVLDSIAGMVV